MDKTYRVKNWEKFQHYKDRRPLWIKLYKELLNDETWFCLSGDAAKLLINIWLLASDKDGSFSFKNACWRFRIDEQKMNVLVSELIQAGFIIKCLYQDATDTCESLAQDDTEVSDYMEQVDTGICSLEKRREEIEIEKRREETLRARENQVFEKAKVLLGEIEVSYPLTIRKINDLEKTYGAEWLIDCFDLILSKDKKINKPLGYAIGILQDWKKNGKPEKEIGSSQKRFAAPAELEYLPDKL